MVKDLYIIASNFQNASTGGLIWMNRLAEYARRNYEKTKIIDLAKSNSWIMHNTFVGPIYFLLFLLRRGNLFIFIDHSLHMRFSVPLLTSFFLKRNNYAVICHHLFYKIRNNRIRRAAEYLSEKTLLRNARIVIVPSAKTSLDIKRLRVNENKITIVNPTLTYRAAEFPRREFRNKILFVGNLEPRKGLDIIIKALSLIKDLHFSLDIIGSYHKQKKYFVYLKKMVDKYSLSKKITFHGRVESERIIGFYRKANILIFPSRHEGFGMVLLEGMSFGLPIVATDIATTREIIRNNVNGYLCPIDDEVCLARKIRKLVNDKGLQMRMGKANFKASRKFRNWDDVVQQTFYCLHPFIVK